MYSKITILGKGYVGTSIFNYLKHKGVDVSIYSKRDLDYSDFNMFCNFLQNESPNYVINCAGFTGYPNVEQTEILKEDCWKLNVSIPVDVNRACRQFKVNHINISSGCIYTGYEKEYTEDDVPNFGLFDKESIFYAKTKHAFETLTSDYGMIVRIRLPYCDTQKEKSYLNKVIRYNNLINNTNSKTSLHDLNSFLYHIIYNRVNITGVGVLNFTNPEPLKVEDILETLIKHGFNNQNWALSKSDTLNNTLIRSNCILSTKKLAKLFPYYKFNKELEALEYALTKPS